MATLPPLMVRCYRHRADAAAVRHIWSAGLLENIAAFGYPPSLEAEEKEFVAETLSTGDMVDLAAAYQSDPAGRTGFWVVSGTDESVPIGCVGLRLGKEADVGDIGRFTVDSKMRGRGAARLLLSALEAHAAQAGFKSVTATTSALNVGALGAFSACGYTEIYRGRQDGKPAPEWVPYVRLQKIFSREINRGPRVPYPKHQTILDMVHHHVSTTPNAVAWVLPEGEFVDGVRLEITYAEMWRMVVQTAQALTRAQARTGTRWVMIVLPQGLQQACAVWGTLLAGCGYVPVDADSQAERLRILCTEISPSAVIGAIGDTPLSTVAAEQSVPLGTFPHGAQQGMVVSGAGTSGGDGDGDGDGGGATATSDAGLLPTLAVDDLCLCLFSSGSTGVPKGICYDHKWLMGGCYFVGLDLELGQASHCLLRCSYVWSVSLYDLFPVTMFGGTLFIPPPGGHMNVQYMAETIEKETIHAVVIQPTLLNLLLDEQQQVAADPRGGAGDYYPLRSLRHVVSSGEKLFTSTAEAFLRVPGLNARLWNMYGATEAGCTYFVVGPGDERKLAAFPEGVPAGVPQSYVDVYIMEMDGDSLTPLPTGQVGEIVFGGGGEGFMARNYWQNRVLTNEKFVETEAYGRLYRTGDAGYWQDGQVLVAGRLDRQVKVRGVRIQPEEIESRLKRYTDAATGKMPVKACLVVPSAQEPIELTAFVETSPDKSTAQDGVAMGEPIDTKAVLAFLQQQLGKVYVPKHIVHLPEGLPRTASGKPDINVLKRLAAEQEGDGAAFLAPEPAGPSDEPSAAAAAGSSVLGQVPSDSDEHGTRWWDIDLRSPLYKFVQDHRYKREPLFPGAGYISLAAEACMCLFPAGGWELQQLDFRKPLPLQPPRQLRVTATMNAGRTEAQLRVSSRPLPESQTGPPKSDGGEWTVHCTCVGVHPAAMVMVAAAEGKPAAYDVGNLYAQLADGGFDYGPQFQALRSVCRRQQQQQGSDKSKSGTGRVTASGQVSHRRGSPFLLDPVDVDAAFQIAPLVSSELGFSGAPVSVRRVQRFELPPGRAEDLVLDVDVALSTAGAGGIDFVVSSKSVPLYVIEGLQLQEFETEPPEIMRLVRAPYTSCAPERQLPAAPRVIGVGESAQAFSESLATVLGNTDELWVWNLHSDDPKARPPPIALRSAALVVCSCEIGTAPAAVSEFERQLQLVEQLLPSMGWDLPAHGRVWLVIVGEERQGQAGSACLWECAARGWAATYPALLVSTLRVAGDANGRSMRLAGSSRWIKNALLDPLAPPFLQDGQSWQLKRHSTPTAPAASPTTARDSLWFVGMELHATAAVAVLSPTASALTRAIQQQLRDSTGIEAVLVLPGQAAPPKLDGVIVCALSQPDVAVANDCLLMFESVCVTSRQCVTLASMAALLPTTHTATAGWSARAAEAASRRQNGKSVVIYAPPLFSGLWFEPPAPTGFHRCSVGTFVRGLADAPANCGNCVFGMDDGIPYNWRPLTQLPADKQKTAAELREFLLVEVAASLSVSIAELQRPEASVRGLEELGVGSLATLRLSQRLRRFLGNDFSAFALQSNPTIDELVSSLTADVDHDGAATTHGKVLCLHGFKTSSAVLAQQMVPLTAILADLGYEVVVPDGPHPTTGAAQGAAGLDEDGDTFGWWLYSDDTHDSAPLGLEASLAALDALEGPFVGVVGFSQGGAMAAAVASALGVSWAVLFSPVYVPGRPAPFSSEAGVAVAIMLCADPADEVAAATRKLITELPSDALWQLGHQHGHRLPPASDTAFWDQVAAFLSPTGAVWHEVP